MNKNIFHKHVSRKYDLLAPIYDFIWRRYTRITTEKAIKLAGLKGGESVLDIGCGTGALEARLVQKHMGLKIFACDVSIASIDRAAEKLYSNPQVTFAAGDFLNIDISNKRFDVIFSLSNLHYFAHPEKFFLKARAAAKPGTVLVLVDWCRNGLRARFYQALLSRLDRGFQKIYSMSEMKELLADTGWIVEGEERFSVRGYWTMVAVKARTAGDRAIQTKL